MWSHLPGAAHPNRQISTNSQRSLISQPSTEDVSATRTLQQLSVLADTANIFKVCCGLFHVTKAAVMVAYLHILVSISMFVGAGMVQESYVLFLIPTGILVGMSAALMSFGVRIKVKALICPFLICQVVMVCMLVVASVFIAVETLQSHEFELIAILIIDLMLIILETWLFSIVLRAYRYLKVEQLAELLTSVNRSQQQELEDHRARYMLPPPPPAYCATPPVLELNVEAPPTSGEPPPLYSPREDCIVNEEEPNTSGLCYELEDKEE